MPTNSPLAEDWPRRQFSAPKSDRGVLCRPSGEQTPHLLARNAERFSKSDVTLCDVPLADLRSRARAELLSEAHEFTEQLRGHAIAEPDPIAPLIAAGHQPELYHPGVWLKNFAASRLAARQGGVALNLIVDTDLCTELTVSVPDGSPGSPSLRGVWLDLPARQQPWEDLRVKSPAVLPAAGREIADAMAGWGIEPLAGEFWFDGPSVQSGDCLVHHLTQLRHDRQQAWDAPLLELPMRRLCRTESFALFACSILQRIDELQRHYNDGLATYRELNRLRSSAHPMPDLHVAEVDGRTRHEAPFWVWRAGEHVRRPLWIEQLGCSFRLYDVRDDDHAGAECIGVIRKTDCSPSAWHRLLVDLDQQGVRVRPRALMTTLFLRLCLADLFIHGIGGAKYDEVTDHLFRAFLGIEPPDFLAVSGTLRLPLPTHADSPADRRRLQALRRDLLHNADRHGFGSPELIERKAKLIADQQAADASDRRDARANYERFRALKSVNLELAAAASDRRSEVVEELAAVNRRLAANRLLASREFSWTLYPEELLRDWLHEASDAIATRDGATVA